jgi:Protein of unknown function (DUF3592)
MARLIAYAICGGFGIMFLYVGITQFVQQRRNLANAERVDAVITESSVSVSKTADTDGRVGFSNSTTSYSPDVRFRYVVSGERYESTRLYPSIIGRGYASHADAAAELAPFPLEAKVRAWVNRSHPDQAFLIGEKTNGPLVFIVLGFAMIPIAWGVGKIV